MQTHLGRVQLKNRRLIVAGIVAFVLSSALTTAILTRPASASTHVGGPIVGDVVWTLAGSPYIVDSDISIPQGSSLTVEAGVEVILMNESRFEVSGNLTVAGLPTLPVNFHSPIGDYPWVGIRAYSTARVVLNHTDLGAVNPILDFAAIRAVGSSAVVLHNVSVYSAFLCLSLEQISDAIVDGLQCLADTVGIYLNDDHGTSITNSTIWTWGGSFYDKGIVSKGSSDLRIESVRTDNGQLGLQADNVSHLSIRNSSFHVYDDCVTTKGLDLDNVSDVTIANVSVSHEATVRYDSSYWWPLHLNQVENVTVKESRFLSKDDTKGLDIKLISKGNTTILRNRFEAVRRVTMVNQMTKWNDSCSGNYWAEYSGTDWNGDGIGDTPLMISNGTWDWLPYLVEGSCYSPKEPPLQVPPGITQVTFETTNQTSPQIYHNYVMWWDSGRAKYRAYDFGSGNYETLPHGGFLFKDRIVDIVGDAILEYQRSTNRSLERFGPVGPEDGAPQISDRYLIWSHITDYYYRASLFYKDLSSGVVHNDILKDSLWAGWPGEYDIEGELVVYSMWTGHFIYPPECEEISISSLQDGWTRQLTFFNVYEGDSCFPGAHYLFSNVHISGNWIVFQVHYWTTWTEPPTSYSKEIYLYSLHNDSLIQISPEGVWAYSPDVSDGWAVWLDNSTGDSDIVLLNLTTWNTYRLPRPGEQLNPRIYRNIVTWQDWVNDSWQVFVANLSFLVTDAVTVPNPQNFRTPVTFKANVLNARTTDGVWVEVRAPGGSLLDNSSMVADGGGSYHYTRSFNKAGTYTFRISAVDDLGRWVFAEGTFVIIDIWGPTKCFPRDPPPIHKI